MEKRQFTIRIDDDILNKIGYIAKKNKRSLNAQVEYTLEKCVTDYEKEHGPIPYQEEK